MLFHLKCRQNTTLAKNEDGCKERTIQFTEAFAAKDLQGYPTDARDFGGLLREAARRHVFWTDCACSCVRTCSYSHLPG